MIMGLSGSGKSTLLRCINRLIRPTSGQVLVNGIDISKVSEKELLQVRRKELAMVFQNFGLLPHRSVLHNIAFGLELQGVKKEEREKKAMESMKLVGLKGYENQMVGELSGGMQQRVGLARALANNPEVLLMDEAFSALDPLIRVQMQDELLALQSKMKKTIVFITHDLSVVKHISHDIIVMYLGQCVEYADSKTLFKRPLHPYTNGLLDAVPIPSLRQRRLNTQVMRGELTSPIEPKPGCRFAARCPHATDACRGQDIPLREVEPGHWVACRLVCP